MFRKLFFIVFGLFVVETYGVYGAAQVQSLSRSCTFEVGPLCYAWQTNGFGKMIGKENSVQVDRLVQKARREFEDQLRQRLVDVTRKKSESVGDWLEQKTDGLVDTLREWGQEH